MIHYVPQFYPWLMKPTFVELMMSFVPAEASQAIKMGFTTLM
jgi:hypothetical protein